MATDTTRAWVEIDLGALRRNGAAMGQRAGVPLLPMIKADGYGLGAVAVARTLEPLRPWGFGVATVAEGQELRDAGVERPLVVFSPLLPDAFAAARKARLTPTFGDSERICAWSVAGDGPWHLAIDTGMAREGVRWDAIDDLLPAVARAAPEGAYTHLHSADTSFASVSVQEHRFRDAVARLPTRPRLLHAENSAAVGVGRRPSPWDLVRPGVFLYGVGVAGGEIAPEPVVYLRARVIELREIRDAESVSYGATFVARGTRRIATVGLGYGDGLPRAFGNRGVAAVNGARVPIAGVVTMDMTMLDVTDVSCRVGDVATFLGRDGGVELDLRAAAEAAGAFPYELLTGLRPRLPRLYRDGDAVV